MRKGAACTVSFAVGAAIGFIFAEQKLKKKYDQMVEQEVESIKASFKKYQIPSEDKDAKEADAAANLENYETLINDLGYSTVTDAVDEIQDKTHVIITEDDFSALDDYESFSLIYLADGVLVDDDYDRMSEEEIAWAIGNTDLGAFADDETVDTMYVKNTKLKVAYEIIKDDQTYAGLLESKPYLGS